MHRSAYRDREESLHGTTHRKQESEESKLLARKKNNWTTFFVVGRTEKGKSYPRKVYEMTCDWQLRSRRGYHPLRYTHSTTTSDKKISIYYIYRVRYIYIYFSLNNSPSNVFSTLFSSRGKKTKQKIPKKYQKKSGWRL
jgi:hypothetical protein